MLTSGTPAVGKDLIGRDDILQQFSKEIELFSRGISRALINFYGRRRIGKSSIMQEIKRRLLKEKVKYGVVPVYINLFKIFNDILGQKKVKSEKTAELAERKFPLVFLRSFAKEYLEYFGIYFEDDKPEIEVIVDACAKIGEKKIIHCYNSIINRIEKEKWWGPSSACELALVMPKLIAKANNRKIFLMLDEIQELTWLTPVDCVPYLGQLMDLWECDLVSGIISGSAVSIVLHEVFGYHSPLWGRYHPVRLDGVTDQAIVKIVHHMFKDVNIQVPKTIMPKIVEFCAGVPFYAVALCEVLLRKLQPNSILGESELDDAIGVVFSPGGRIYEHFNEWIIRACQRINQSKLTTLILKSLAKRYFPDPKEICLESLIKYIQEDFGEMKLNEDEVWDVVKKLDECDILKKEGLFLPDATLAKWLEVVEFPIRTGKPAKVDKKLLRELITLKQKLGVFFEVVLACLFMSFDGKTRVPGEWVGREDEVVFPKLRDVNREYYVTVPMGNAKESDVVAWSNNTKWLVESKLWDKKVHLSEIENLIKAKEYFESIGRKVQIFYFAKNGFTQEAEQLLKENNAYIVTKYGMNKLLETFGLSRYKI
jgi:hypothetical protein